MSKVISQFKAEKRKIFRAKIRNERVQEKASEQASKRLSDLLAQLDIWQKNLVVASYRALPDELSVEAFQYRYKQEYHFVFPRIKEKTEKIGFVPSDLNKTEDWEQGLWPGTWQPSNREEVPLPTIDVFLVPAIAFDREGRRLGRGKGFYDRVLFQTSGIKIGVAGVYQISNEDLPEEDHDVRMDAVVTDRFVFVPLKSAQMFT